MPVRGGRVRVGVGVVRVNALYRLPIHILKKKLPNNFNQTTIDVVHFLAQRPGPFFLNCHFPFIVEDGEGRCSISSSCPCPRKNKKRKKERKGSHNSNQDQMDVVHFFALHPVLIFLNCRRALYCWCGNYCSSDFVFWAFLSFFGHLGLVLFSYQG